MQIKKALHQYSLVELLLAIDANQDDDGEIKAEIERRSPSEAEFQKANKQIIYIKQKREVRANKPLSPYYWVMMFLTGLSGDSNKEYEFDSLSEYEEFINQSGYTKKVRQIQQAKRYGSILMILFFLFAIVRLLLYYLSEWLS